MAIDTAHDATEVLDAVRRAADEKDWPLAYGMLLELHESSVVVDAEWTEVRYLLGEACWALNDPSTARSYYEQAAVGAGGHAAQAMARLDELARLVDAEAAAGDGVSAEEQMGVIAVADEAKGRGDFDTAIVLYRQAYELHTDDPMVTGWLAVDLGECHVALQRYDEAKEWFDWALTIGDDSAKAKAQAGIDQVKALDTAQDMASDGTQASEVPAVNDAATAAYANDDTDSAIALWSSLLENPVLTPQVRGATLFNLGQAHIKLRDYDTARAYFAEADATGVPTVQAGVAERLGMLERRDDALHTAGLLPAE